MKTAKSEAFSYLDDRSNDLRLFHYTNVAATFLKYNTDLPSSVPVERLFSVGVKTGTSHKLVDVVYVELLLLQMIGSYRKYLE